MWARHTEAWLGIWLVLSPFILRHASQESMLWTHDLVLGSVIVLLSLASHWRPLHRAHLALLPIAVWLMGAGWWRAWQSATIDVEAAYQNWLLLGILLAVFAVVPSEASKPPHGWRNLASPSQRRPNDASVALERSDSE